MQQKVVCLPHFELETVTTTLKYIISCIQFWAEPKLVAICIASIFTTKTIAVWLFYPILKFATKTIAVPVKKEGWRSLGKWVSYHLRQKRIIQSCQNRPHSFWRWFFSLGRWVLRQFSSRRLPNRGICRSNHSISLLYWVHHIE